MAFNQKRRKTAVEEEEDESDKPSSDGLTSSSEELEGQEDEDSGDSSDEGGSFPSDSCPLLTYNQDGFLSPELVSFNPRARQPQTSSSKPPSRQFNTPKLVSVTPSAQGSSNASRTRDRNAAFGEHYSDRRTASASSSSKGKGKGRSFDHDDGGFSSLSGGGMEVSWTPGRSGTGEDSLFDDGRGMESNPTKRSLRGVKADEGGRRGKVERFGSGMEKGGKPTDEDHGRNGRTKRRTNVRSGSRNAFRQH